MSNAVAFQSFIQKNISSLFQSAFDMYIYNIVNLQENIMQFVYSSATIQIIFNGFQTSTENYVG